MRKKSEPTLRVNRRQLLSSSVALGMVGATNAAYSSENDFFNYINLDSDSDGLSLIHI